MFIKSYFINGFGGVRLNHSLHSPPQHNPLIAGGGGGGGGREEVLYASQHGAVM